MDAYLWLLPVVFPAIGFFWCCCIKTQVCSTLILPYAWDVQIPTITGCSAGELCPCDFLPGQHTLFRGDYTANWSTGLGCHQWPNSPCVYRNVDTSRTVTAYRNTTIPLNCTSNPRTCYEVPYSLDMPDVDPNDCPELDGTEECDPGHYLDANNPSISPLSMAVSGGRLILTLRNIVGLWGGPSHPTCPCSQCVGSFDVVVATYQSEVFASSADLSSGEIILDLVSSSGLTVPATITIEPLALDVP